MPYAIELDFDGASSAAIMTLTEKIFADCGGMPLTGTGAQPHVSLAALDQIDLTQLQPLLADFAAQVTAFPLHFAAAATFPGDQGVVYLAPIVTADLLALHRTFYTRLALTGLPSRDLYHPDHWVPHCTVGFNLPPTAVGNAVALCREFAWVVRVMVTAVSLIEFHPQSTDPTPNALPPANVVTTLCQFHFQPS